MTAEASLENWPPDREEPTVFPHFILSVSVLHFTEFQTLHAGFLGSSRPHSGRRSLIAYPRPFWSQDSPGAEVNHRQCMQYVSFSCFWSSWNQKFTCCMQACSNFWNIQSLLHLLSVILTARGPRGKLKALMLCGSFAYWAKTVMLFTERLVFADLSADLFYIFICTLSKAKSFSSEDYRCCLFAENAQPGEWVQGIGWNEVTWGGPNPNKRWLDEVCAYNPIIIHRMCWHKAVISSSAGELPW